MWRRECLVLWLSDPFMKKHRSFLVGVVLGVGFLLALWGMAIYQFGTVGNSIRYLQGYNYVVTPTTIDVGEGPRRSKRTTTATVRNLSFSPIRVIGVVTTCNCLIVTGLPLTIAPRQTEELKFTISLESSKGEVEQIANVLIDDGQMQRLPVVITGRCTSSK
jgi:hypothetical protein